MIVSNSLVARALLTRGAILWLLVRALVSVVIALADGSPLAFDARASLIIIGITVVLCYAQMFRLRESVLLGNLGVSHAALALCFGTPALLGELIVSATWAALR